MPRTMIVLQTQQEPGQTKLNTLLEALMMHADVQGLQPLKVHALAPKPNGQTDAVTVSRHQSMRTTQKGVV